jgi:hypothetical protein
MKGGAYPRYHWSGMPLDRAADLNLCSLRLAILRLDGSLGAGCSPVRVGSGEDVERSS